MILSGAKQIDITPHIGIELGGYGARVDPSSGIHDPLRAQVLYLTNTTSEILMIGLDLLAVDANFTQSLRVQINAATQIPKDAIMVSCTHTHSGPAGFAVFPSVVSKGGNQRQRTIVIEKLVGAVQWAIDSAEPVSISKSEIKIDSIGSNRNDDAMPIDDALELIRIDKNKQPYALIVNYGCHPTVMGASNLLISADLPGAARKYLEKLYPSIVMLFFNGGAGNVSTRFTRRSQGFDELDRFGLILFSSILKGMQIVSPINSDVINFMRSDIGLQVKKLPSLDEAKQILAQFKKDYFAQKGKHDSLSQLRVAETKVQGARRLVELANTLAHVDFIKSEIQVIILSEVVLIAIPGEPYTEISLSIKDAFPGTMVMVVGYANDYQGYFTMDQEKETYETLKSPWTLDVGERIVEAGVQLISEALRQ